MNENRELAKYIPTAILLTIVAVMALGCFLTGNAIPPASPDISLVDAAVLVAIGFITGVLGGIIGSGGGTIMLPILCFWLGYTTQMAIGTALFAAAFTAISGAYGHLVRGNVDRNAALWLAGFGIIGVIPGSWLFGIVAGNTALLELVLGFVFLIPAIKMMYEGMMTNKKRQEGNAISGSRAEMAGFGFAVGVLTGLTGLGGGYALVPGLIYLFNAPVYLTMGTSLAVIMPMSVVGGAIKLAQGFVAIGAGLLLTAGTIIGAQLGAAIIKKFEPAMLKLMFGVYFAYVSIKCILLYFGITIY